MLEISYFYPIMSGRKINNFYYKYTLYPAEVLKSLSQKTFKSCCVISENKLLGNRAKKILVSHNFIPVDSSATKIEIDEISKTMTFKHENRIILECTNEKFFSFPKDALRDFSMKVDQYFFFRKATLLGLMIGFPIALYLIIFSLFHLISNFFVSKTYSSIVASVLCFLIGIILLFQLSAENKVNISNLSETLQSESYQDRIEALKVIVDQKIEIGKDMEICNKLITSPHVSERLWLTKAFGVSQCPETHQLLFVLLDDPCPNVVRKAFSVLGQRNNKSDEKEIVRKIMKSDHWYNQLYAYKALKQLGWDQKIF